MEGRNRLGHRCRALACATSRAKRSLRPAKPIAISGRHDPDIYLVQNHGGRNSDDNENNNLGRIPALDHRRAAIRRPIRCRKDVREILAIPAAERTARAGADCVSLLAHHGAGMERGERRDRAALAGVSGRDQRNWYLEARARSAGNAHPDSAAIS